MKDKSLKDLSDNKTSGNLLLLGINHKTASSDKRGLVAFNKEQVKNFLLDIKLHKIAQEVVIISTCNRTELYFYDVSPKKLLRWLQLNIVSDLKSFKNCTYILNDGEVVNHLYRVASGLDSMVLGEAEILGQIKNSYKLSLGLGLIKTVLGRLFESGFAVAKQVKNKTNLGIKPISIAYIAVLLIKRIFSNLSSCNILLLGAGDTARLVMTHLLGEGVEKILIANRNLDNARSMAARIKKNLPCSFICISQLQHYLQYADIVIAATASSKVLITKDMLELAQKKRKYKPIALLDLAMPFDIASDVQEVSDAYLYNLDNLQEVAAKNHAQRQAAAKIAESIAKQEAREFSNWQKIRDNFYLLKDFKQNFLKIEDYCVKKAKKRLQSGVDGNKVVERLAYDLRNKFFHKPMIGLKEAIISEDEKLLGDLYKIFKIKESEEL